MCKLDTDCQNNILVNNVRTAVSSITPLNGTCPLCSYDLYIVTNHVNHITKYCYKVTKLSLLAKCVHLS